MAKRKPKAKAKVPFGGYTISFKGRTQTLKRCSAPTRSHRPA